MDRLPVFKALGDNTRYAIYLELARASRPLSTADIADALELHPNTVRPHLDRMREVGLLEVGGMWEVRPVDPRSRMDRAQPRLRKRALRHIGRIAAEAAGRSEVCELGDPHALERSGHQHPQQART